MPWRDLAESGFPDPHEREPANLRRDIADEIADHLACALQHELRRTDAINAERNVLGRFGDPRRLARQLWFAAMKEHIMKDRLLIGLVGIMTVATIAATAFSWSTMVENRRMNEAVLAGLAGLQEDREEPVAAVVPVDPEKATVSIQLVEEISGEPVVGQRVIIIEKPLTDEDRTIIAITDDGGNAVFGPIPAGTYFVGIPMGKDIAALEAELTDSFGLYPGKDLQLSIEVPSLATAPVSFEFDWQSEKPPTGYVVRALIYPVNSEFELSGRTWSLSTNTAFWFNEKCQILTGAVQSASLRKTEPGQSGSIVWDETTTTCEFINKPLLLTEFTIYKILNQPNLKSNRLNLEVVSTTRDSVAVFTPVSGETNHVVLPIPAEQREQIIAKLNEPFDESTQQASAMEAPGSLSDEKH